MRLQWNGIPTMNLLPTRRNPKKGLSKKRKGRKQKTTVRVIASLLFVFIVLLELEAPKPLPKTLADRLKKRSPNDTMVKAKKPSTKASAKAAAEGSPKKQQRTRWSDEE